MKLLYMSMLVRFASYVWCNAQSLRRTSRPKARLDLVTFQSCDQLNAFNDEMLVREADIGDEFFIGLSTTKQNSMLNRRSDPAVDELIDS